MSAGSSEGKRNSLSEQQLEETEDERLAKDQQAREQMKALSEAATTVGSGPGSWKWPIRKRVWKLLEEKGVARDPKPIDHRIPNFAGADEAAQRLAALQEFENAEVIKVNPDTPQKGVRMRVLGGGKTLVTPQPRLRTGFFSTLHRDRIASAELPFACTSAGVREHGAPVSLQDDLRVGLVVVGSVAVNPANGCRIGKGEGFAELEYGIMRWMGAVDEHTLVVTTVHDLQLVDDIEEGQMLEHDVPVDIVVTPTQVIRTGTLHQKPPGILWEKLSPQKLAQIRILRELKASIEAETGQKLPTGPDESSRQSQNVGHEDVAGGEVARAEVDAGHEYIGGLFHWEFPEFATVYI
eukprot:CAMPEP_0177584302 /NCGR_PEP_ID=MMETSP0419_2-20121207/3821_1 /TAXON_ID=582737 /ORGANISM="Tetraselmis sp., Strain GSL018" /LENGTH=351 /DNA_ID=CAMNT_0019073827 /DNA_START=721 /DNA_END=1777 /DNA_ORIENTATION=-